MNLDDFVGDRKTVSAATRDLRAHLRSSAPFARRFQSESFCCRWPTVVGAGNVYRHEYEVLDDTLVWHTIQHGLATLRHVTDAELKRLP